MRFLAKELLTARYDSRNNKILGCEEGTVAWWHERGHQERFESGASSQIEVFLQYFPTWAMVSLIANDRITAAACMLIYISGQIYEELMAWKYAFTAPKKG